MKKLFITFFMLFNTIAYSQIEIINTNYSGPLGRINRIGNTVFVSGWENFAIRSSDDFNTFDVLSLPSTNNGTNYCKATKNNLFLTSINLGGNSNTQFWKSEDTGSTWILKKDTSQYYSHNFAMFDSLNGISVGLHKQLNTNDGCISWTYSYYTSLYTSTMESYGDSIVLAGVFDGILHSSNRGTSWVSKSFYNNTVCQDLEIISKDTFYTCGETSVGTDFIAYTFQGIDSMKIKYIAGNRFVSSMVVLNPSEIYMTGNTYDSLGNTVGAIFKTNDLGNSLTTFNTGINSSFFDILFLNDSIALICGSNGALLKWNKNTAVPTSVADVKHDNVSLGAYPNPTSDKIMFYFNTSASQVATIMIQDAMGRVVAEQKCYTHVGSNNYYFDVHSLPRGVYFSTIRTQNSVKSIKFIKQ